MKKAAPKSTDSETPFPLRGYLILNLVFWIYCAAQLGLVRLLIGEITGLIFFFGILAAGFTIVSALDYLYDRWFFLASPHESTNPKKA